MENLVVQRRRSDPVPAVGGPRSRPGGARLVMVLLALLAVAPPAAPGPARPELDPVTFALPQQTVTALELDSDGFLWVGTLSGLARWDGYEARTFSHVAGEATSLAANLVSVIARASDGTIWVETPAGVQPFLGVTRGFGAVCSSGRLARDGAGTIWVVSPGGLLRARGSGLRPVAPLPPRVAGDGGRIPRPLGDGEHGVWIATGEREFQRWDGSRWRRMVLPVPTDPETTLVGRRRLWTVSGNHLRECVPGPTGWSCRVVIRLGGPEELPRPLTLARGLGETLWVGTDRGAYRVAVSDGTTEYVELGSPGNRPSQMARRILVGPGGTVWLGTVTGVWHLRPFLPAFEFLGGKDGLSGGFVTALAEDRRRHLWVGLYGGGIDEILPRGEIVVHHPRVSPPGEGSFEQVWALLPDPGGDLWVGADEGLALLEPGSGSIRPVVLPPPRQAVTTLVAGADPRTVWVGRFKGGVVRLEGPGAPGLRVYPRGEPPSWDDPCLSVRSLRLAAGSLWIGTDRGLLRLDPVTGRVAGVAGRPGTPPLCGTVVWQVLPAGGGRLWVATDGGLDLVDPEGGTVEHVLGPAEIPGATVYRMEAGPEGWLWLSTNHGLLRFDPRSHRTTTHRRAEGVLVGEFNRGASCRRRDGTLLFGGNRGLVIVHPERVPAPHRLRPPVAVSLRVLGPEGWTELEPPGSGGRIGVPPGARAVQVVLARPLPFGTERVRYRFRVNEHEGSWIDLGSGRSITLARTAAGTLHLAAEAAEGAGPWSDPYSLAVEFRPAFWERTDLRFLGAALAAALVGLAGWGVSVRRYHHRMELARAAHRLAQERDRIARDLHDEIGAGLTSISFLAELLGPPGEEGGRRAAERIGATARRLLESLDSLIWAVDPRHDSLEETVALLREAAAEAIEAGGAVAELRFPEAGPPAGISGGLRQTMLLVLREAVANALRHGGAHRVRVRLDTRPGWLRLEVEDDGRGFDPEDAGISGHGLGNMRARARRVGGSLQVSSVPGSGTRVILEIPLEEGGAGIPQTGDRAGDREAS